VAVRKDVSDSGARWRQKGVVVSLFEILGATRDNAGYKVISDHLKKFYLENTEEKSRMAHAAELDEFYEGRGDNVMQEIVDIVYKSEANRESRKAIIKAGLDKYDNIVARIVREKATVYSEPARRTVADKDDNLRYQTLQELSGQDDVMRELDRKLALHENALLWYRVRQTPTGEREPVLEVISPASFWAVCHPNDRTLLVAIIFDQRMPLAKDGDPAYRIWTDDETFVMNTKFEIDPKTIEAWPLGVMPGVLASTRKPGAKPGLLEQFPSTDLLSAQKGIRLQAINLAKESVSAVRQTYITGDTSATAMGQNADTNTEIFLGEGVTAQALDRGMDQEQFRDNGGYIGDAVAANHGLAPSVLRHRDASSGAEIELRRTPIRELRKQRIPVMRRIEARIAKIIAMVNGARATTSDDGDAVLIEGDLPEMTFSLDGWAIDFGEIQQVLTESERDAVFEARRRLGLTDNYEEELRRNPDLRTIEDAVVAVDARLERQTMFVRSQKELMALNGSLGSAVGEKTAEENGADGQDSTVPLRGRLKIQ
jgi:hypothetical protein